MIEKKYIATDYERLRSIIGERCEGSLEFPWVTHLQNRKVHSQRLRGLL